MHFASENNVCNTSSVFLLYVYHMEVNLQVCIKYMQGYIYTRNHAHIIIDVSVSYIDAIDS